MHCLVRPREMINTLLLYILTMFLCFLMVACNGNVSSANNNNNAANGNTTSANVQSTGTGPGAQGVHVFVEPDASDGVILDAINGARRSVWLEMYLLTESKVIKALENAAQNGVDVRVMLESHPYGSGPVSPLKTRDKLKAANVKIQWSSPIFALTHEKGMVIDGTTAYIMTCNFTLSALGGSSSTRNREYGIIDTNTQDVQAVQAIFNADWAHTNAQFNDQNLVVSPDNSRPALLALINSAQKTLALEAEEMQDGAIEQALISATKRGVQVQVILPAPSGSSGDSNSEGITTIKQGGVQVKEDTQLYMHAKIIIADGQKAFVGSENISTASLDGNRELGILVADSTVLATLQQTFQQDWGAAQNV